MQFFFIQVGLGSGFKKRLFLEWILSFVCGAENKKKKHASYLSKTCTHGKVDDWVDAGVRECQEIDDEHREDELTLVEKVVYLGDRRDDKIWAPAKYKCEYHDKNHLRHLEMNIKFQLSFLLDCYMW